MNLAKIAAPILRGVGFFVFPIFLFYFLALVFSGGIREAWWCGPVAFSGLAMIWAGDYLKKRIATEFPSTPSDQINEPQYQGGAKAILSNIVGAMLFSLFPGAGQAFNGESTKAYVYSGIYILAPFLLIPGLEALLRSAGEPSSLSVALIAMYAAFNLIALLDALFTAIRNREIPARERGGGWTKGLIFAIAIIMLAGLRKLVMRSLL